MQGNWEYAQYVENLMDNYEKIIELLQKLYESQVEIIDLIKENAELKRENQLLKNKEPKIEWFPPYPSYPTYPEITPIYPYTPKPWDTTWTLTWAPDDNSPSTDSISTIMNDFISRK